MNKDDGLSSKMTILKKFKKKLDIFLFLYNLRLNRNSSELSRIILMYSEITRMIGIFLEVL
jgi:hypothetical protein